MPPPYPTNAECGVRNAEWQGGRRQIGSADPVKRASGSGNRDQPNHTTCSGQPLSTNPTYSAFWSVFGVTCPRLQRLASSVGFGTTARVTPGKNLPDSGVTSEPVGCYATPAQLGGSSGICRTTRPVTCYEEA